MSRLNRRIDAIRPAIETKDGGKKRRKEESKPPRSDEEANRIFDELWEINPLLSLTAQLCSLTGLRYTDAAWLRYDDFYDEYGNFRSQFQLCQQKVYRQRVARNPDEESEAFRRSQTTIYNTSEIQQLVEETRFYSASKEYLFANRRSQARDESGQIIERPMSVESASAHHLVIRTKLKLPYTLGTHSWRKYFVAKLVKAGASVEKIRDLLGQASLTSTNHYLHSEENELKQLVNNITLR